MIPIGPSKCRSVGAGIRSTRRFSAVAAAIPTSTSRMIPVGGAARTATIRRQSRASTSTPNTATAPSAPGGAIGASAVTSAPRALSR